MQTRSIVRTLCIAFCLLTTLSSTLRADDLTSASSTPFVSMNVGVEISGLDQAAEQASEGLLLIGESLDKLANNHELTPEQNRQVQRALSRVEDLGETLNDTVEQIPGTVEQGLQPVVNATHELSGEIKQILIIACVALVVIILAALLAVYYFVLAPATRSIIETAELLNRLADTLESTAKIVEKSSQHNQQVMETLQQLQQQAVTDQSGQQDQPDAESTEQGQAKQPEA